LAGTPQTLHISWSFSIFLAEVFADWTVVTARQLAAQGQTEADIRRRVRRGELVRARRGVFLVGQRRPGADGWFQDVAVAAVDGPHVVLTGQAAAALSGFDGFEPGVPIAVQVAPSTAVARPRARRLRRLEPPERVSGIWCTSPGETLLGLAADLRPRPGCSAASRRLPAVDLVELAVEPALRNGLVTIDGLAELCARADAKRPGRAVLLDVLDRRPDQPPTESYLETRLVQLLRDAGLPTFDRQVELRDEEGPIGRVDFTLASVVVEAVGRQWHLETFGPDHRRYARLAAAGHVLLPVTFEDAEARPTHVVRAVTRALARATT
jgi:very-short-patch-repair endonuclease